MTHLERTCQALTLARRSSASFDGDDAVGPPDSNWHVVGGALGGGDPALVGDLGGGDVAVAEEVLDLADLDPGAQEPGRGGRPK
jgi:hypothetical protein